MLRVARVLPLFWLEIGSREEKDEYAFVQYMKCTDVQNRVHSRLNCVCPRLSIDDEVSYSVKTAHPRRSLKRKEVGECFRTQQLSTIKVCVPVVRGDYQITLFTEALH